MIAAAAGETAAVLLRFVVCLDLMLLAGLLLCTRRILAGKVSARLIAGLAGAR